MKAVLRCDIGVIELVIKSSRVSDLNNFNNSSRIKSGRDRGVALEQQMMMMVLVHNSASPHSLSLLLLPCPIMHSASGSNLLDKGEQYYMGVFEAAHES